MENEQQDYISLQDIIQKAKEFFQFAKQKFATLFLVGIVGIAIASLVYYFQKPKYEAYLTFILEEKSAGGGGLAGIASQFGFDLGSISGGGSLFAGDNVLEIMTSRKIIEGVLLSPFEKNKKLIDHYLEFTKTKEGWSKNPRLKDINYYNVSEKEELSPIQDSILYITYKEVTKNHFSVSRASKKASIIKVVTTSSNELFSKLLTERVVEAAKNMYIEIKTSNSSDNVKRLQRRADSILYLLNQKTYSTAESLVPDANPARRIVGVPTELSARDKMVLQTLYTEVVKNLEVSKMALSQQTPVIQLLDTPSLPLQNNKKGLLFHLFVGALISGFIGLGIVFVQFLIKQSGMKW